MCCSRKTKSVAPLETTKVIPVDNIPGISYFSLHIHCCCNGELVMQPSLLRENQSTLWKSTLNSCGVLLYGVEMYMYVQLSLKTYWLVKVKWCWCNFVNLTYRPRTILLLQLKSTFK